MTAAPMIASSSLPTLYTVAETAARLKVSKKTIRRRIDQGALVAHRLGGRVLISEPDLAAYIRSGRNA